MLSQHLSRKEIACKCGCGKDHISPDLVALFERIRARVGPLTVTSGVRCPKHNRAQGGKADSAHVTGLALDIACTTGTQRFALIRVAMEEGCNRIGVHPLFIHLDVDTFKPTGVIWMY